MTLFKTIRYPLKILPFLLLYFNFCSGQTLNNDPSDTSKNANSAVAFKSLNAAINGIDKNIRSIFQDSRGNYWFGTNGSGVYRYDGKTLTAYTTKDGLANNQVLSIQEDDSGTIWFGTGLFGISKFDGTKCTTASQKVKITNGGATDWKSKNKDSWFFAGGGVFRYRKPSIDYLPFAPTSSNAAINSPFTLSRYGVYCILKDKKGNLWFGTQAEGVCRYDGKTLTWFKEKGLAGPAVLALFEDSKGRLWFGNNGSGLFRYEGETLTNITIEKGLQNADFRASEKPGLGTLARVYSINEDPKGTIWIGTVDAGVWKYDGNNLTNYTTKDGLSSNAVNTIYKDKNGALWFGTDDNGICKFNGTRFSEFTIQ